jgi:hypothetical protein
MYPLGGIAIPVFHEHKMARETEAYLTKPVKELITEFPLLLRRFGA